MNNSLEEHYAWWSNCTACDLGKRREATGGQYVFGEGDPGGILFIGEGPGVEEERAGVPFVGTSGKILRNIIEKLQLSTYYITNIVSCRACVPVVDEAGNPRLRKGLPIFKDEKPLPTYIESCRARLEEEIYLVDPVVIVTLGNTAAEAILRRSVSITKMRGSPEECWVTGRTSRPVLTEKKNAWVRKSGGRLNLPTEPNKVHYLVVPTLHPAYVARQLADKGPQSPFRMLVDDINLAKRIFNRYVLEAVPTLSETLLDIEKEPNDENFDIDFNFDDDES